MKNRQGYKFITLMFYLSTLLLAFDIKADEQTVLAENKDTIEEGWVEKKIAPSTLWMESEIQREVHTQDELPSANRSNIQLISVQKAIHTVLKEVPGKVLRSQFKTGPPPYYKIKILTEKGMVSTYNVHAFNGNLYSPSNESLRIEEARP